MFGSSEVLARGWNINFSAPLSLSALLLIIVSACGSDDPSRNSVIVTVMAAEIEGILIEEDGCLRINGSRPASRAIVWQKDVLAVERQGDALLIDVLGYGPDRQPLPTITWRLGDEIRGGGGLTGAQVADEHAGAGFSERCEGPYWLLGAADPVE